MQNQILVQNSGNKLTPAPITHYRSAMRPILRQVEMAIAMWAMRKYKKLHRKLVTATRWLRSIWRRKPNQFAHWAWSIR